MTDDSNSADGGEASGSDSDRARFNRRAVWKTAGVGLSLGTGLATGVERVSAAPGDEVWHFPTGGHMFSSPTVVDGTMYVGSRDNNLYAVDAATGTEQWLPRGILLTPRRRHRLLWE